MRTLSAALAIGLSLVQAQDSGRIQHATQQGHVAISPDGTRFAEASPRLCVRSTETGVDVFRLEQQPAGIVVWSTDGTRLAVAEAKVVAVRDATTGRVIAQFDGLPSRAEDLAFSPDGAVLAAVDGANLRTWRVADKSSLVVVKNLKYAPTMVRFSPDGQRLLIGGNRGLVVLDAATGGVVQQLQSDVGSPSPYRGVWRPGTREVAGAGALWNADTGARVRSLPIANVCGFTANGRQVISHDGQLRLIDVETGTLVATLNAPGVLGVTLSADGRRMAIQESGQVTIWALEKHWCPAVEIPQGRGLVCYTSTHLVLADAEGLAVRTFSAAPEVRLAESAGTHFAVASADGKRFAGGKWNEPAISVWDSAGTKLRTIDGPAGSARRYAALSRDGSRLALVSTSDTGATFQIYSTESGQAIKTLEGDARSVVALAFSPDGKLIAGADMERTARLWSVESGKEALQLGNEKSTAQRPAFSPDGRRVAVVDNNGQVRIFSLPAGDVVWSARAGGAAWSPDGQRLVLKGTSDLRVVEADTGRPLAVVPGVYHDAWFQEDGARLVVALPNQVSTLDPASYAVRMFSTGIARGRPVASANGKFLALRSTQAQVWDLESLRLLGSLTLPSGAVWVHPLNDGKRLLIAMSGKNALIWNLEKNALERELSAVLSQPMIGRGGNTVAVRGPNGGLGLFDADKGTFTTVTDGASVDAFAFSRDGKQVASMPSTRLIIFDAAKNKELKGNVVWKDRAPTVRHLEYVDDKRIAIVVDDGVHIVEAATGKLQRSHAVSKANRAYLAPDGKRLIVHAGNGIRVLDPDKGEIGSLSAPDGWDLLLTTPDRTAAVFVNHLGEVQILPVKLTP